MNFQEAESAYLTLKRQLDSRQITPTEFTARIAQLRVQAQDGVWWQIREDGAWLQWNGQQWVETGRSVNLAAGAQQPVAGQPTAAAAVVGDVVHGIAADTTDAIRQLTRANIIRYIRSRLFFMILTMLFSWWFHTYLLIVKNNGFNPENPVGKWIYVTGNLPSSAIIWGLVSALIWSFIYSVFTMGPIRAVVSFVRSPFQMAKMIATSGKQGWGALGIGAGMALLLASAIRFNHQANFAIGFVLSFFGLSQPGWLLARFLAKVWMQATNAISKQKQAGARINLKAAHMLVVGMCPGFLVASLISPKIAFAAGIILITAGVVFFFNINAPRSSLNQIGGLLFIGSMTALIYGLITILFKDKACADDGGLSESGGSVRTWIKSQGAPIAVAHGAPPAASSAAGALVPPLNPVGMDPMQIPQGTEMNGKVWCQPPWDEGGPYWMDKTEYLNMKSMRDQGYVWSNRYGWKTPDDMAEAQRQYDRWRQSNQEADRLRNEQIQKEMRELKAQQERDSYARKLEIERKREELAALERQRERDNSWSGYIQNVKENYDQNVVQELDSLPQYAYDTARAVAKGTKDFVIAAYNEVTDLDNYKGAIQAAGQTVSDVVFHPVESSQKVDRFYRDVAKAGGNIVKAAAEDPVSFGKAVLGVDNWEKAMDPNVPLGERIGRVLYGTVDIWLNIAGTGVIKGTEVAAEGAKIAKAADELSDVAKAEKVLDKAEDLKKADDARRKAWHVERANAQKQVDEYAKLIKDPNATPEMIEKATLDMQSNKQAIYELNRRKDEAVTTHFNNQMNQVYDKTDEGVKKALAEKYGVSPDDIHIEKPTNIKPGDSIKAPHDRDITARRPVKEGEIIRDPDAPGGFRKATSEDVNNGLKVDVPSKELSKVYKDEFYNASNAEKHFPDISDKGDYLKKMDQTPTDRLHADAYGSSTKDLETAIGTKGPDGKKITYHDRDFTDAQGVGKTVQYKADEWYAKADDLRAKGDIGAAETHIAEGNRQLTKQFDNLVKPRVEAAGGTMPPNLEKAVNTLKLTEKGVSPSTVDKLLNNMGYTRDKVAQQVGGLIESTQKFKPK